MGAEGVEDTLGTFLRSQGKSRFDLVCVFSVTMWVHLNHGDEGLRSFLSLLCRLGRYLLLEPQPWKCYQTASRRMRRLGLGKEEFPLLPGLKVRGPAVEQEILATCQREGLELHTEFGQTKWNRKLILMKYKDT